MVGFASGESAVAPWHNFVSPPVRINPRVKQALNLWFMAFPPVLVWEGGNRGQKLERHRKYSSGGEGLGLYWAALADRLTQGGGKSHHPVHPPKRPSPAKPKDTWVSWPHPHPRKLLGCFWPGARGS